MIDHSYFIDNTYELVKTLSWCTTDKIYKSYVIAMKIYFVYCGKDLKKFTCSEPLTTGKALLQGDIKSSYFSLEILGGSV